MRITPAAGFANSGVQTMRRPQRDPVFEQNQRRAERIFLAIAGWHIGERCDKAMPAARRKARQLDQPAAISLIHPANTPAARV